jgi:hypothetical protein
MDSPHSRFPHVFAIVRFDLPIDAQNVFHAVNVVKVFATAELAETEATRLRQVNDETKCVYRVQTTRLVAAQ